MKKCCENSIHITKKFAKIPIKHFVKLLLSLQKKIYNKTYFDVRNASRFLIKNCKDESKSIEEIFVDNMSNCSRQGECIYVPVGIDLMKVAKLLDGKIRKLN